MSLSHLARTRVRRTALIGLASAGAAAGLGLAANPAAAYPTSWEINNYSHYAAKTQEEGRWGARSDEFYVLSINFQVQLGVKDTFRVTTNDPYEIDNIDQGEDHAIEPRMGQAQFDITQWDPTHMILLPWENQEKPERRGNKGPWVFGTFTQVMESDLSPWSSVRGLQRRIANAIQANLKVELERATPTVIFGNLASQLLLDAIDPNNRKLRDEILNDYITGNVTNLALATLKNGGIWNVLGSLFDDPVGPPTFSIVAGIENYTVPHPLGWLGVPPLEFNAASAFNTAARNSKEINAANSHVFALPERRRGIFGGLRKAARYYTQRHSGSDATYDMSVRAGER